MIRALVTPDNLREGHSHEDADAPVPIERVITTRSLVTPFSVFSREATMSESSMTEDAGTVRRAGVRLKFDFGSLTSVRRQRPR